MAAIRDLPPPITAGSRRTGLDDRALIKDIALLRAHGRIKEPGMDDKGESVPTERPAPCGAFEFVPFIQGIVGRHRLGTQSRNSVVGFPGTGGWICSSPHGLASGRGPGSDPGSFDNFQPQIGRMRAWSG